MQKTIIAPSILSGNFANLEADIIKLQDAGADWIHVDVMDGHFVPNITIGALVVKALKKVCSIPLDVHLMISNPHKYIDSFAEAGADIITFHYETTNDYTKEMINKLKKLNVMVGLSIKPKTPPEFIKEYLNDLDLVLIMTVEPGFGGQEFIFDAAKKIEYIRKNSNSDLIIEVDGGINEKTGKICKKYGANALVAGNYIYKSKDMEQAINSLR